jgi:hypothetical protein
MNIAQIEGKVFRSLTGDEFGVIRKLEGAVPNEIAARSCTAFAEDECGNYFVEGKNFIGFWDHETNEIVKLANSDIELVASLVAPKEVQLHPCQVVSAWIDPSFLAEQKTK